MSMTEEGIGPAANRGYRAYVLALLMVVYTFNFIDRQILAILLPYIKAELHFTDSQLGLLGGPAFAVVYSTLAIPIAWLADRVSRVSIVGVSLAVWSAFTALCGFSTGFWTLFGARMGVGVGEAGGVAPSYSLVADYFPKSQRARALAFYSFGVPIGTALGYLFGGLLAEHINWRIAFMIVGGVGVLLFPLLKFTVKDPVRGGFDRAEPVAGAPEIEHVPTKAAGFGEVWNVLLKKPSFWFLAFGAACSSVYGYGAAFWLPSFFQRSMGMEGVDRALYIAGIAFIGGTAGIWLGGWLADKLGKGLRPLSGAPGAQPCLAGAGGHLGPASGAGAHAIDRFGQLPADQQSGRHRSGHLPAWCRVGLSDAAFRRGGAALFALRRSVVLRPGGHPSDHLGAEPEEGLGGLIAG
ncbi:MAG: major facilitator superfamily protein [bacterium]|nr:MAG: major facilitator superfamily protein [bacterium]